MLYCITSYFNPIGYQKFRDNYTQFRKHLQYPLITVELSFDNQPFFIDDAIHIRGNKNNVLWQKERLLNIAIENLPNNVDKIAWLDADIIFHNSNWYKETEKMLDSKPVCQLFEYIYEKTPDHVRPEEATYARDGLGIGFAKYHVDNMEVRKGLWPKPGLCWGFRRDCLPNGLYDKCIVGNNDLYQLIAWMGHWYHPILETMNKSTCKDFLLTRYKDYELVKGDIGYINGTLEHLYHGTFSNRKYVQRNEISKKYNFDATADITLDNNNIYKWQTYKPKLHTEIYNYFYGRRDDE
jgi:hypothetical protein